VADIFSRAERSRIMSNIKPKDSKPELLIRSFVHSMGYRFRLHRGDLPGKPDLVFPKSRKVIFVHGCFWHGHRKCKRASLPVSNLKFWNEKISGNIARDKRNYVRLKKAGWKHLVVWQCQISKKKWDSLRVKIHNFLSEGQGS
jgi:DNA mismatch endonuclease (patch repair protein)